MFNRPKDLRLSERMKLMLMKEVKVITVPSRAKMLIYLKTMKVLLVRQELRRSLPKRSKERRLERDLRLGSQKTRVKVTRPKT